MKETEKVGAAGRKATSFKPIGAAARLVTEKLARALAGKRAFADLQKGDSE